MTAPERFAEKSDSLLHRGRRPYMTHSDNLRPSIAALRKAYSIPSSAATSRVCGTLSAERKSPAHVNGGAKKPASAKIDFLKLACRVIIQG